MNGTGIVRRLDDLGRIVIPKELRRTLRLKEGDPIEISRDGENLFLKKYSPVDSIKFLAQTVADGIAEQTKKSCLICDADKVIYSTGGETHNGQTLNQWSVRFMNERKTVLYSKRTAVLPTLFIGEDLTQYNCRVLAPIINNGDCYGLVALSSRGEDVISEKDEQLLMLAVSIISNGI